jgi:hypothetical protein
VSKEMCKVKLSIMSDRPKLLASKKFHVFLCLLCSGTIFKNSQEMKIQKIAGVLWKCEYAAGAEKIHPVYLAIQLPERFTYVFVFLVDFLLTYLAHIIGGTIPLKRYKLLLRKTKL